MKTFRNNNRRTRFRNNDRGYKRNGDLQKFNSEFTVNSNFQRKAPGRNNHNAPKLIEKYNDLAREALSKGDKILSENYFQHAEHFARILSERQNHKLEKDEKNSISHQSQETSTKNELDSNQAQEEIGEKQLQKV